MAAQAHQLKLELQENPVLNVANLERIQTAIALHLGLVAFFEDLLEHYDEDEYDEEGAALVRKMPELFRVVRRRMGGSPRLGGLGESSSSNSRLLRRMRGSGR